MPSIPSPLFSYSFDGIIWRILPDRQGQIIVLEIREKSSSRVNFAAIDVEKGILLWENDTLAATPWSTAIALSGGLLFLQTYTESTPPQVVSLTAFDVTHQQLVWERSKATYSETVQETVWVKESVFDRTDYYQLSRLTGDVLNKITHPDKPVLSPEGPDQVQYPVYYNEDNRYWKSVTGFLKNTLHVNPVKVVEYTEKGNFMVISYYIYQAGEYDNWLGVFDQSGMLLWQEKIGSSLPGTGINTFLITNSRLIFVKEKNQVIGHVL